jgi:hypothetical protein
MKKLALLSVLSLCIPAHAERAKQADTFADSIGINTHITYTNTDYFLQWNNVVSALRALHVRHIRDGFYPWPEGDILYQRHQQLHSFGIDCDYVTGFNITPEQVLLVKQLAGDMAYLEAPNESDDQGNASWASSLTMSLPGLYIAGEVARVPVIGPTFTRQQSYSAVGDISPWITYNGLHIYFGGRNPGSFGWGNGDAEGHSYGSIDWWLDNAQTDAPGVPSIVTETGYLAPPTVGPYELPESVEVKYAPRTALEMFSRGIVKSYFYELLDDPSQPGYGLLRKDFSRKPAFTAVSNLIRVLSDPGGSFQPGVLNYQVLNANADVHHLLLQKRDGSFYLALWMETPGYDPVHNKYISVQGQNVTLQLEEAVADGAMQFQPAGNIRWVNLGLKSESTVWVSDNITIVRIVPQ